ncbi:hypothetical protein HK405_005519, partial [Cladochytrium tenue]
MQVFGSVSSMTQLGRARTPSLNILGTGHRGSVRAGSYMSPFDSTPASSPLSGFADGVLQNSPRARPVEIPRTASFPMLNRHFHELSTAAVGDGSAASSYGSATASAAAGSSVPSRTFSSLVSPTPPPHGYYPQHPPQQQASRFGSSQAMPIPLPPPDQQRGGAGAGIAMSAPTARGGVNAKSHKRARRGSDDDVSSGVVATGSDDGSAAAAAAVAAAAAAMWGTEPLVARSQFGDPSGRSGAFASPPASHDFGLSTSGSSRFAAGRSDALTFGLSASSDRALPASFPTYMSGVGGGGGAAGGSPALSSYLPPASGADFSVQQQRFVQQQQQHQQQRQQYHHQPQRPAGPGYLPSSLPIGPSLSLTPSSLGPGGFSAGAIGAMSSSDIDSPPPARSLPSQLQQQQQGVGAGGGGGGGEGTAGAQPSSEVMEALLEEYLATQKRTLRNPEDKQKIFEMIHRLLGVAPAASSVAGVAEDDDTAGGGGSGPPAGAQAAALAGNEWLLFDGSGSGGSGGSGGTDGLG